MPEMLKKKAQKQNLEIGGMKDYLTDPDKWFIKSKKIDAPVAILTAFWHYIIYCDIDGTWWLKEITNA